MKTLLVQLWNAKQLAEINLDDATFAHSYHVMTQVETTYQKILAILHDVYEDNYGNMFLAAKIIDRTHEMVMDDLKLLSHDPKVKYRKYIQKLAESGRADAIAVKLADLEHNMDLSRLEKVEQYHLDRNNKYKKAHRILTEALTLVQS